MSFKVTQVDKRRIRSIRVTPREEDKKVATLALVPILSTALNESLQIAPVVL